MAENINVARRVRLLDRCHVGGSIHERGDEVVLLAGVRGPHRAVQKTPHKIDYDPKNGIDANHTVGEFDDVPLYEVIEEIAPKEAKP